MTDVGEAIRHGLHGLAEFRGRDDRGRFWPYACAVLGVGVVGGNAVLAAILVWRVATAWSEGAGASDPGFPGLATRFMVVLAVLAVTIVVLLAAAVTRRLHDRGLRGGWACVPLVLLIAAFGLFVRVTRTFEDGPDAALFVAAFVNNGLYLLSVGLLAWQLARAGHTGGNRFGPPTS